MWGDCSLLKLPDGLIRQMKNRNPVISASTAQNNYKTSANQVKIVSPKRKEQNGNEDCVKPIG